MVRLPSEISPWPVLRQIAGRDRTARGAAAKSARSSRLEARTATADRVVKSVCPYCAVGCAQNVYVKDERVVQIEGDPDSPVSRGRLCPKGAASLQLTTGDGREHRVLYRPPNGRDWESLDLETAMGMIADRVIATREASWEATNANGEPLNRTLGFGILGGATLDTEENYLLKKLFTAAGAVSIENQARI
jgi:formate dehydrogenase major subunit